MPRGVAMQARTDQSLPGCPQILIVDADPDIRAQVASALREEGYRVATTDSGQAGLRALYEHHPQLIILALILPDLDGWTVLERIREVTDTPVVVLSRRWDVGRRLRAFELRAQDYITEPFHVQELVLRVHAAIQHGGAQQLTLSTDYDDGVLHIDGWTREVLMNQQQILVTPPEMRLLLLLIRQPGRLLPYGELLDALPSLAGKDREAALRSLVHRLRRKLSSAAPGSEWIITQRNLGIRLNVG
jgi:DNA-binding response OmpR family regulator